MGPVILIRRIKSNYQEVLAPPPPPRQKSVLSEKSGSDAALRSHFGTFCQEDVFGAFFESLSLVARLGLAFWGFYSQGTASLSKLVLPSHQLLLLGAFIRYSSDE